VRKCHGAELRRPVFGSYVLLPLRGYPRNGLIQFMNLMAKLLKRALGAPVSSDLTTLANHFGSDKGDKVHGRHCYTTIYQRLFDPIRNEPIRLLEVGLQHPFDRKNATSRAPSIEMWRTFFPHAQIFGFDINDFSKVQLPNCVIVKGDMGQRADLQELVQIADNPFDVIIEDASHASHHQQIALGALFPHLSAGGLYIIEDLHWQPSDDPPGVPKTRDVLRAFCQTHAIASPLLTQSEADYLNANIAKIDFYDSNDIFNKDRRDGLAVIRKVSA
jgi:hypothetical protein